MFRKLRNKLLLTFEIINLIIEYKLITKHKMSYNEILVILMLASPLFAQMSINIEDDKRLFKVENATLHESLVDDITFQALLKNAIYRTPDKEKAHQKLTNLIEQKVYCFYFQL